MLSKNDLMRLYDTVLASPGMNEMVKIDVRLPRRNVLLLHKIIVRGLAVEHEDEKAELTLQIMPKESLEQIQTLGVDLLQKAGLTEVHERLSSF